MTERTHQYRYGRRLLGGLVLLAGAGLLLTDSDPAPPETPVASPVEPAPAAGTAPPLADCQGMAGTLYCMSQRQSEEIQRLQAQLAQTTGRLTRGGTSHE